MSVEPLSYPDRAQLRAEYRPPAESSDEMCTPAGGLRPQWEYVIQALEALGAGELEVRAQDARRLLRENGVTYNVYDGPHGAERFWALDLVPLLLTSQEWSTIERGLIQRADLLNLILADLYGPRTLIHNGLLPPEVIYAHPGFLLPCYDLRPPTGRYLSFYATDLARGPQGTLCVIGDRTQAPSGAGYALENRIVLSRVLPSLYRDSHVHRLALFFRALRATLTALAPSRRENPRIVVLTPGPGNETYFEHAFLAQYLGCTLAQGSDLTVRDSRVWLATLDGLQPVDVILRRVDDTFCDPLELRRDSVLGVPGLLQAARRGGVALVNPLGSGVLENPALMAFLPKLAKHLLGQDLQIPSVATWWCGDEQARAYVLANLERLVIEPIGPHPSTATLFGAGLSAGERRTLAERIRAQPHLFVGQEQVAFSTAPVLANGRLEPRPMVLRSFLVVHENAYVVMPGGLTRVTPSAHSWVVSNQGGGVSKDTWVLASEPERAVSLLPPPGRLLPPTRSGGDVPVRVADNVFWLGRYAERVEGNARLLRVALHRLLESDPAERDSSLLALLRVVTHQTGTYPGFVGEGAEQRLAAPEAELLEIIFAAQRMGSVRFTISALTQAARSARDRLPDDSWRVINRLRQHLQPTPRLGDAVQSLDRIMVQLAAFAGLSMESMSRGQGWRFWDLGRRLERALQTAHLLRVTCVSAAELTGPLWDALLAITDTTTTYRRRYRAPAQANAVLDLLLLDESTPRAVAYQVARLQEHVAGLPRKTPVYQRSAEERLVLEALTALRLAEVERLMKPAQDAGMRDTLDQLLARLGYLLRALSDALSHSYFSQTDLPQQLVNLQ